MENKSLYDQLDELKAGLENFTREEVKAHLGNMETEFQKMKSDAKKNQEYLDSVISGSKQIQIPGRAPGLEGIMGDTVRNNEQKIRDFMQRKQAGDLVLEVKTVGNMYLGNNLTGGTASVSTVLPGIYANPPRKQHIGELLGRTQITGDMIALRENGTGEGAISAVGENATKPQRDYDLQEVTFPANYIAGYSRVSRRFMISVPNAMEFLTKRLTEDYLVAEDYYLLNGSGTPPEPKGINVSGNYTPATSYSTDNDYNQLILGVGQLSAMGRYPDLIILHPNNLYSLLINRATGSGEFDTPSVVQISPDGSMRLAGCQVVPSTAQAVGTYSILDRSGFIIGVLEALNVRFFDSDQDNVIKNLVTVRVESNIAFGVIGSTYAVVGTF